MIMPASGKKACFQFPERRLSYAKIMPASGKKACFQFPERRLSYAMILKGECNIKSGKRSFTGLDTAEPHHILCKDTAKEVRHKRILFIFKM
ncbi:hypothetical protein [Leyella lascolaii]|uniref:hypothetical protein n=1 Tax=Leyella lascolaii TaxID=1776379 RepID=UPI002356CF9E|nr:hypothetical protein [Leyella lascolaii]